MFITPPCELRKFVAERCSATNLRCRSTNLRCRSILLAQTLVSQQVPCLEETEYGGKGQRNFHESPGRPYLAMPGKQLRRVACAGLLYTGASDGPTRDQLRGCWEQVFFIFFLVLQSRKRVAEPHPWSESRPSGECCLRTLPRCNLHLQSSFKFVIATVPSLWLHLVLSCFFLVSSARWLSTGSAFCRKFDKNHYYIPIMSIDKYHHYIIYYCLTHPLIYIYYCFWILFSTLLNSHFLLFHFFYYLLITI